MIRFDPNNEGGGPKPAQGKWSEQPDDDYGLHPFVRMDGYNDCIIGVCHQFEGPPVLAYDMGKVIESLMGQGMTHGEAVEFFEYNQLGASVGPLTPVFINTDADCLPDFPEP
tara:strand:+ start:2646 stop:2981 length:336 start_codon:yes stop_codon:yes gene_type:complete